MILREDGKSLIMMQRAQASSAADQVEQPMRDELKLFHQALKLYRAQDWEQAELQLYNLLKMAPTNRLYHLYNERIAKLRLLSPGPGWDGVWVFEIK